MLYCEQSKRVRTVAQAFSNLRRFVLSLCLVAVACPAALAQATDSRPDDPQVSIIPRPRPADKEAAKSDAARRPASIRIDTTLVQIPVTVTDR